MNRENKRKKFEKGYYKTHPCRESFTCKVCGRLVTPEGAGSDHRKFIRQIFVSVDFDAPLYWWKEYDTYKIATVANSTSTMHKIAAKPFELDDFSHDHMNETALESLKATIAVLEQLRQEYLQSKDKQVWYSMIQLLPTSYHQLRTCSFNYETLVNIYHARKNHKLEEWHTVCDWIRTLPYAADLITMEDEETA